MWTRFFGWICKMLGLCLYFVQFLDWMQQSSDNDKFSFVQLPVPKAPHEVCLATVSLIVYINK